MLIETIPIENRVIVTHTVDDKDVPGWAPEIV
jgi:hypothetical protein